jgi:hypothetical protein
MFLRFYTGSFGGLVLIRENGTVESAYLESRRYRDNIPGIAKPPLITHDDEATNMCMHWLLVVRDRAIVFLTGVLRWFREQNCKNLMGVSTMISG